MHCPLEQGWLERGDWLPRPTAQLAFDSLPVNSHGGRIVPLKFVSPVDWVGEEDGAK